MTTLQCQVCNSPETKYKCATCRAPSCSLSCFKQHRGTCADQQTTQVVTPEQPAADQVKQAEPTSAASTPVIEPADLKDLFRRYPLLQSQLRDVYQSTRDPAEIQQKISSPDFSRRGWRPEKGFENGLNVLRRLTEDDSASSEGIAAFMKLIAEQSTV